MNTESSKETPNPQESGAQEGETTGNGHIAGDGEAKTNEWQEKLQEAEKKYLYLYSDFENFRRRNERERTEFLKFGNEGFLRDLLQVVDNFDRALVHARSQPSEKGSSLAQVSQGIEMIHLQMMEALRSQGVAEIQAIGKKFDPAFHEAVGEEEADAEPGMVLKEMQKGYLLHGRLLRAARVIVAKKKD